MYILNAALADDHHKLSTTQSKLIDQNVKAIHKPKCEYITSLRNMYDVMYYVNQKMC